MAEVGVNDNRKWLYDALTSKGVQMGAYEEFEKNVDANKDWLYNTAQKKGIELGDYDSFNKAMSLPSVSSVLSQQLEIQESDSTNQPSQQPEQTVHSQSAPQRSKSPSPYVEGKGKDTTIFGVPYNDYQQMSSEEQSKAYGAAIEKKKTDERAKLSESLGGLKGAVSEELGSVTQDLKHKEADYVREHPFLSIFTGYNSEDDPRYRNLKAAENLIDDAEKIVAEAGADKSSALKNFGRGVRDAAFDVDTWTAGITDLGHNLSLKGVLEKANKGEELSSDEEKLLDASVINLAATAFSSSDVSMGYRVGQTSANSIPFMLEFAINPISSSGNTLAKGLLKYGLKRFGKAATTKAAKVSGRLVGDAASAAGMTATSSAPRVMANTVERLNDNYSYSVDDDGELAVDKTGDVGTVEALARSGASQFLENQSEMVFNAFVGGGKMTKDALAKFAPGISKLSDTQLVQLYKSIKNNPTVKDVARRTQFHGLIGEYAEEVYNNFANIPLDEMTVEDATDLDKNVETFLSLAPTSVLFGAIGLGGMARERYSAQKNLRRFTEGLNEEDKALFDELQQVINAGDKETAKEFIKRTLADATLTQEEKKERVFAVQEMEKEHVLEDVQDDDVALTPEDIEANKVDIYRNFKRAERKVNSLLPGELVTQLDDVSDFGQFASANNLDEKQVEALADYLPAKDLYSKYVSYRDGRKEEAKVQAREQATVDIEKISNPDTGNVTQAKMFQEDNPVYITGGHLVFGKDGILDKANSSERIYYIGKDGKSLQADPSNFDSILSEIPTTEMIAQAEANAEQDFITAEEEMLASPDIPAPAEGVTVIIDGSRYLIEGDNVDEPGSVMAIKLNETGEIDTVDGGERSISIEDYYNLKEAELWGSNEPDVQSSEVAPAVEDEEAPPAETDSVPTVQSDVEEVQEETPEQKLQKVIESLPKKKDGSVDYKALTPQQQFDYTSAVESPEVAIEDLKTDVAVMSNELEKLNARLAKATGGERAEIRDLIRAKKQEQEELNTFYQSVMPAQSEETSAVEESVRVPEEVRTDEDYIEWVAENSDDANEVLGAYSAAKDLASHEQTLKPWQRELLGRKVSTTSFNRFGDRNQITGSLAKGWLRKDGQEIDAIAQELSENGTEVTEQDIVDFMLTNPTNHVSQISDSMRTLSSRFSEIASKEMGIPVGGPESNTGKLYIKLKEANQKLGELNDQQKTDVQNAVVADMDTSDTQRTEGYSESLDEYAQQYDQFRQELAEEDADEAIIQQIEKDNPALYHGNSTAEELDDIYSQIENNNGTERQAEDSRENQSPLSREEVEQYEESGTSEVAAAENSEGEEQNLGVSSTEQIESSEEKERVNQQQPIVGDASLVEPSSYSQENGYKVLNSESNSVSLQGDNQKVNENDEVSQSIPQGEHGTETPILSEQEEPVYQLRRRIEEASRNASESEGSRGGQQEVNRMIETQAKDKGLWTPLHNLSNLGIPFLSGNENDTYLDRENAAVYKMNNLMNSKNLPELFKRIDLHNEFFPDTKYDLVGFTGFGNGSAIYPIYKQDYIDNAEFATPEEIGSYMEALGFTQTGEAEYSNEDVTISDLRPRNVLKDTEGDIYVIDAEFKRKDLAKKETPTPIDKTTDTGENQKDLQSDTALLQDVGVSSADKDSKLLINEQENTQFTAPRPAPGENVLDYANRISESKRLFDAEHEVNTNPTEAQKTAGNYKKGHIQIDGYNISIENPKGSERSGVDANGQPWSVTMNNSYGYIRGTEGVDGDHIDVFLSDHPTEGKVYVIDQMKEDGSFDEHKVMYGFNSALSAKSAYKKNYSPGWKGLGKITEVSKEVFNDWVKSSKRKTKPFAEYKIAKEKANVEMENNTDFPISHLRDDGMIVNEDGTPMILYHGTINDGVKELTDLEPGHRRDDGNKASFNGWGVSFTPNESVALDYSNGNTEKVFKGNVVLKKPYYAYGVENLDENEAKEYSEKLISEGHDGIIVYASPAMREIGATPNEIIVFSKDNIVSLNDNTAKQDYGVSNKLVSKDRYEELKSKLRGKLGQMNVGFDPELFAIGAEMAAYHIEAGARKFGDFAQRMVADVGDAVRPYLKSFYEGARQFPGMEGYQNEMDEYQVVKGFDTESFDKAQTSVYNDETLPNEVKETKGRKSTQKAVSSQNKESAKPAEMQDLFNQKTEDNGPQRRSETKNHRVGESSREETGGLHQRGMDRSHSGNNELDETRSRRISEPSDSASGLDSEKKNTHNNRNERGKDYAPSSPKARFEANVEAIKLMRNLMERGETIPSANEMQTLRKYSGWGGLGTFFNNEGSTENKTLRELLDEEEYNAATMSINSAYYTPASVIDALWDAAGKLGFKGGAVLEGSAGIGSIIGAMPESISERSSVEAVEIDSVSGNILKLLYPDAKVHIQGFQDTTIKNGSVDLAITNVPFVTGLHVYDKQDKDLSRKFKNIHDFCIAKNIRKLREGGLGIFITSNSTLDKSRKLREWIIGQGNADVIGAFRLNNATFGGTNATSDIIIVRKRIGNKRSPDAIDVLNTTVVRSGEYETGEPRWDKKQGQFVREIKPVVMEYNNYFQQHPENMAGEMAFAYEKGDTFRPGSVGLYPAKGKEQDTLLQEWIKTMHPIENGQNSQQADSQLEEHQETTEKEGTLILDKNGELCVSQQGEAVPLGINKNKVKGHEKTECLKDYNTIKTALTEVLDFQINNNGDKGLEPLLNNLNKAYDGFVSKYGPLNRNTSISFLKNDVDFPSIAALEDYSESKTIDGKKEISISKTSIFKGRVIGFKAEPEPKTVKDGVIASVYKFGNIDTGYIAERLQKTEEDVKNEILKQRLGFVNPTSGGVEVRYEYLSGNVREKLELAKVNNLEGEYNANIEELEKVIPMDIPAHLIEFSLGSSWIEPQLYREFLSEEFGITDSSVEHVAGAWIMKVKTGKYNEKNRRAGVYSEKFKETIMGDELVGAALNNKTIAVKKTYKKRDGSTETVADKDATQACTTRISEIKDSFKEWARGKMQQDEVLAEKIMRVYNDKFNAIVPKSIDDIFLPEHFGGSADRINLYPHQKKAVIRGTTEPLMLAHEVGTGKTFTLISTAMEMRRIGTAKKPMIVVQNATVGQFVSEAKKLYPNAKILTLTDRDRTPEGRRAFYAKIKYSDWDIIVVPQSTFEMIPDSPERQLTFIRERIDDKLHALEAMQESGADESTINQVEKELTELEKEFATVASGEKSSKKDAKSKAKAADNTATKAQEQLDRQTDDVQFFDEMGVDAILVDEAHEYKRLGFSTAMTRGVKGIDPAGSKKAAGVYLKTRAVLEQNGWKNVVFATGTPISNTAAELWTFMKYLMPKEVMIANDIYYFDDFVRNFGNISQSLEFATNGKFKENTRFAAYINKPELIRLWASVSDTVLTKEVNYVNDKVPKMEGDKAQDIFLPQSDGLIDIMRAVRKRLDEFEKMSGKEKRANSSIPLTMYGIAKRAAIDTRLVDKNAIDEPNSKTNKVVEETLRSLKETENYKGTVAIFCDNQRRWDGNVVGFDLFEDIKQKLISNGIPEEQIVVMMSGMSIPKKEKIFADVNAGNARVIIGNTQTLGTGVNIQERLHTLIHMDAPDRPMDYTQRNGRILRQGNLHRQWDKPVRILRFGVEDSLDVTSYQRLKTKAGFIDSIMDGKSALSNNQENRTLEEEEEGLFDNPVAVLSGSQYALLKNQAEREYRKFANKKLQYEADQIYVTNKLRKNEGQIKSNQSLIAERKARLDNIMSLFPNGTAKVVTIAGKKCVTDAEIDAALRELVNKPINEKIDAARKNPTYKGGLETVKLSLDGVDVDVQVRITRESEYDNKVKGFRVVMHKNVSYSSEKLDFEDVPVSGGYVRNALDDLLENVIPGRDDRESIEALERANEKMQEENELMSERKGNAFEYEKELKAAESKVEEYTQLMQKELAEKEAKYADRGSSSDVELSEEEDSDLRFSISDEEVSHADNQENAIVEVTNNLAKSMHTPVLIVRSIEEVKDGTAKNALQKGRNVKGWYDVNSDEVVVYLPNIDSVPDAQATILHEIVAHKGLRDMLGKDAFDKLCGKVFDSLPENMRVELMNKYGNRLIAGDEYMASIAENGIDVSLWDKIKGFVRNAFLKIGVGLNMNDNDIRYLLWKSKNRLLSNDNGLNLVNKVAADMEMRDKLGIGEHSRSKEQANYDRAMEVCSKFQQEHAGAGEVFIIHSKDLLRKQLEAKGVMAEDIDKYEQWFDEGDTTAFWAPQYNTIFLLDTNASEHDLNCYLWHENAHKALDGLEDYDDVVSTISNYVENELPELYDYIADMYKVDGRDIILEECVSHLLEYMAHCKMDRMKSIYVKHDNELVDNAVRKLIDIINYGEENQKNQDRLRENFRGWGNNGSGSSIKERQVGGNSEVRNREIEEAGTSGEGEETQLVRFRDSTGNTPTDGSIEQYEKELQKQAFKAKEAYQDSMLALKKLQDVVVKKSGKVIKSFEDAYTAENHLSSKNTAEMETYGKHFFRPLMEEVGNLINNGNTYDEIKRYVFAKHGLERNEVFAQRDARNAATEKYWKQKEAVYREYDDGKLSEDEYEEKMQELQLAEKEFFEQKYEENRLRDYSGLTSLTEDEENYEALAQDIIDNFERDNDVTALWKAINNATKETLKKTYESGLMSKSIYEKVNNQFNYYIPLRGWNEDTASDVYEYLQSEVSPVNATLKSAKGRMSLADDPFATIGNMAESNIFMSNRNLMKQRFMNMVLNHPSDLVSLSEAWYVMDNATGDWILSTPDINENDKAEEIRQKLEEHEERMEELAKSGEATKVKEGLSINYRISDRQAKEHMIVVKRNGKEYVMYVNGNPRAAQAINGLTNPNVNEHKFWKWVGNLNRQLAANFTTRNPAFVATNLSRDLIYSVSSTYVKEGTAYGNKFVANIPKAMRTVMRNLRGKEGTAIEDIYFKEFFANGGETGYANLKDVEAYKKFVKNEIGKITGKKDYFRYLKACASFFSMLNRWAENVSRFNAYMTSREMGKNIFDSVSDAKEITVNFNKKGAGYNTKGFFGLTSGTFRELFLFFNAGVQALNNFSKLAAKNKKGFIKLIGGFTAAGYIVPILNTLAMSMFGDDGDDDYYNNLSEWVRRNNLCLYIGGGKFLTVPLPIELRAFYGLGEMAYQETVGHGHGGKHIAYDVINQLTELMPINPLGNNGDIASSFTPDIAKPWIQLYNNKDFTGKPIYKENSFNEYMPEWTKTYNGTSKWLKNLSEWSNDISGGNKYKRGLINFNPAKVEHLFESYFGGLAKTINQASNTLVAGIDSAIEGDKSDDLIWRNAPVLNRFVNDGSDDRTSFSKLNRRYYELYDVYRDVKQEINGYKNEIISGNFNYLEELSELQNSKEYDIYKVFEQYRKSMDKLNKLEKSFSESNKSERKKIENRMMEIKQEIIKRIDGK